MMLEGAFLGALYFVFARFIGSKLNFKVHIGILILLTAITWFLTVLLLSYYLYTMNSQLSGSAQGSLVGGPAGLASISFFLGFQQGKKVKAKSAKNNTIKSVLDTFDEAKKGVNNMFFDDFVDEIRKRIVQEKQDIMKSISESGRTPRAWAYRLLSIQMGKILQNGELHIYRGTLNSKGNGLLKAFDFIMDKLVEIQDMPPELAAKEKIAIRNEIRTIG